MTGEENDPIPIAEEIVRYYQRGMEAGRLTGAEGELEMARIQEILMRYLPEPPARVLDVGGGPGVHAAWLARLGYEVYLIDPLPLHLEQARRLSRKQPDHPITSIGPGEARKLSHADASADAVLLFGPLYHLTEREARIAALTEAKRVLRVGGYVFAMGISRFASTLDGLISGYLEDPEFERIARQDLEDGQHRNPTEIAHYFTRAFLHHPDELRDEVKGAGLRLEKLLAVQGVAVFLQDLEDRWADLKRREQLLNVVCRLEDEPSVLGVTGHLIAVARAAG